MSSLYSDIGSLIRYGLTLDQKTDIETGIKNLDINDNDNIEDVTSYIYALFLNLSQKGDLNINKRNIICDRLMELCKNEPLMKRIYNTAKYIKFDPDSLDVDFYEIGKTELRLLSDPSNLNFKNDTSTGKFWIPPNPISSKSTIVTFCIDVEDIIYYCARAPDRGYNNVYHYYEIMSEKLLKTDHPMYIIVGENIFDLVYERRKEAGLLDKTVIFTMNIEESPYYPYHNIINKCFDLDQIGYNIKTCKNFEYRALFMIWWTKFKVIEKAIKDNPFNSDNFTWVDFGLMRPDITHRTSDLLIRAIESNPVDKIRIIGFDTFTPDILNRRREFYINTSWSLCAGYISFPSKLYQQFMQDWNSELMKNLKLGYPSSEELIMSMVYWNNPNIFDFVLGDYNDLVLSCLHMCTRYDIILKFFTNLTERLYWGEIITHGKRFLESIDIGKINMNSQQLLSIYDKILMGCRNVGDSEKDIELTCGKRMAEILSSLNEDLSKYSNYISTISQLGIKIYRKKEITFINDGYVKIKIPSDHKHSNTFIARVNKESLFRQIHTYLIRSNIIDSTKNVIDLGAWIGDNVMPWSKLFTGKIYAIDPSSENCEFIQIMKEMNSSDNIKILQTAISESNRVLHTHTDLHHTSFVYGNTTEEGSTKVESTSLDSLYENRIIEDIGYIHLDVEGMEFNVVNGSKSLIDMYRPVVSYEVHLQTDIHVNDLKKHFLSLDYKLFLINEILFGCHSDCRNILAIPSEKINVDFIKKYSGDLNILNNISYCIISHQDYMCHPEYFESYDSGKSVYDQYNGGSKAAIFVKIFNHGVFNEIIVLEKYGIPKYTDECDNFIRQRFSTNPNKLNNLIPILE